MNVLANVSSPLATPYRDTRLSNDVVAPYRDVVSVTAVMGMAILFSAVAKQSCLSVSSQDAHYANQRCIPSKVYDDKTALEANESQNRVRDDFVVDIDSLSLTCVEE